MFDADEKAAGCCNLWYLRCFWLRFLDEAKVEFLLARFIWFLLSKATGSMLRMWAPVHPLPPRLNSLSKRVFTCWFSLLKLTGLVCGPIGDWARIPFGDADNDDTLDEPFDEDDFLFFFPFLARIIGGDTEPLLKLFTSEIMRWWLVGSVSLRFSAGFLTSSLLSTGFVFSFTRLNGFLNTTALTSVYSIKRLNNIQENEVV